MASPELWQRVYAIKDKKNFRRSIIMSSLFYIIVGFILLLIIAASVYMVNRFQSRKTAVQNIYQVMFYMFLAGMLFFVFIARIEPSGLVFIAIPVTFVLSNYFHRKKSPWIHEFALWILLGLVVYVQLMA